MIADKPAQLMFKKNWLFLFGPNGEMSPLGKPYATLTPVAMVRAFVFNYETEFGELPNDPAVMRIIRQESDKLCEELNRLEKELGYDGATAHVREYRTGNAALERCWKRINQ